MKRRRRPRCEATALRVKGPLPSHKRLLTPRPVVPQAPPEAPSARGKRPRGGAAKAARTDAAEAENEALRQAPAGGVAPPGSALAQQKSKQARQLRCTRRLRGA